ncbi:MAG: ATP-binding protein [Bacteroidales bacterium]|jgi:MinD superfamily P-loop ATPase|nr:ATP-binding protein [Bacteroidales bacterium]
MKIAIASGKGGTGKTFVSTNLYKTAVNYNIPVDLVDCDAEEPNVSQFLNTSSVVNQEKVFQHIPVINTNACTFCGKCYEYCNYNAIMFISEKKFISVVEELCHDCGACVAACNYGAITEKEKSLGIISDFENENGKIIEGRADVGVYSPVPIIKKSIQKTKSDALVLMDSPPGISCPFVATVAKADYVLLVTEPTPFGLNDLKLSVETLQELNKPYGVIINRAGLGNNEIYDWLQSQNIEIKMEIPFDKKIARTYSEGNILVDVDAGYLKKFYNLLQTFDI